MLKFVCDGVVTFMAVKLYYSNLSYKMSVSSLHRDFCVTHISCAIFFHF